MSGVQYGSKPGTLGEWLWSVVRGPTDRRLRATWRVLLAWPMLWILTGGVLTGNLRTAIAVIPSGPGPVSGLAQSLLHAGFFALALVAWARHIDQQPLSSYGVSVSREWILTLFVGFAAVIVSSSLWTAVATVVGGSTFTFPLSPPEESLLAGLVLLPVALLIHAAIQQVVFFRILLKNGAEGLHYRGVTPTLAGLGALPVAILIFIGMHGFPLGLRFLDLTVAGAVFGLLYLHTGELALGIGVHFAAFYAGTVPESLPGVLGVANQYGFPILVVAYLLLLGWLQWRDGEVAIQRDIAHGIGR